MKSIIVDCCRHCMFVGYLEPANFNKDPIWRSYCDNEKTQGRDIDNVDSIPYWCCLEDATRPKQEIEYRLNGFHKKYRSVSGDNIDPELEASIRELKWVLRGGKTK